MSEVQDKYDAEESAAMLQYIMDKGLNKNKIKNITTSEAKVNDMRKVIIQTIKPLYIKHVENEMRQHKEDKVGQLSLKYFEKRINTLPKDVIIDLYDDIQKIETWKSQRVKEEFIDHILTKIDMFYSLDGWFSKVMVSEAKNLV